MVAKLNPYTVATIAVSLLLLVWWGTLAAIGSSAVIDGVRTWWLFDDAMISMRYARNLVEGAGLVWNPGERVEGYTNFLWVIVMALVHLFPIAMSQTSLVVIIINLVLAAAAIPLLTRIVRALDGGTLSVGATLAAYVLSQSIMVWTLAGSEVVLLMVLLLLATVGILQDKQPSWLTYALIGGMTLVRSDAVVLAFGLYLSAYLRHREHAARSLLFLGLSLLIPFAHLLFRLGYYGDLLPNTAYLKVTSWDGRLLNGIAYLGEVVVRFLPIVILLLFSRLQGGFPMVLWMPPLLQTLYLGYVGGDIFPLFRLLVPIIPAVLVMTFVTIERIPVRTSGHLVLVALCLLWIPLTPWPNGDPGYPKAIAVGNIAIAKEIQRLPAHLVAEVAVGTSFYFAPQVRGVDLLGKVDPYIARLPARYGNAPGHNKMDLDFSLATRKPEFIIASFTRDDERKGEAWLREVADAVPWRGELFFNALFRTHCYPYPVVTHTWRTIYACDWDTYPIARKDKPL